MKPLPSLHHFLIALCAIAFSSTSTSAFAQEARKIKFRTLCMAHSSGITELTIPAAKKNQEPVAVPIYTASISPEIEGTFTTPEAVFYTKTPGPDGKPLIAAKVPLAKAGRHNLLFFIPAPAKDGAPASPPYDVQVFVDDTEVFKLGSIRAINLAPNPVRYNLGGENVADIPAGGTAVFPQSAKKDAFNMYPVALSLQDTADGSKWNKVYSGSWKASGERREIVVTFVDEQFKQLTVKVYPDIPPWTENKGAK